MAIRPQDRQAGQVEAFAARGVQVYAGATEMLDATRGSGVFPAGMWWFWNAVSVAVFAVKAIVLCNVVIWLRWTLPRVRIDQMMTLCWKYLVPAAFACFVFTLFWQLAGASAPALELGSGLLLTGLAGTPAGNHNFGIIYVWLVWWALLKLVLIPFLGRFWCSICPIPAPGDWIQRRSMLTPRPGSKLYTYATGLFRKAVSPSEVLNFRPSCRTSPCSP